MVGLWSIFRRELAGLRIGLWAWVLLALALLLNGYVFLLYMDQVRGDVGVAMQLSLGGGLVFWVFLVLLPPLLTMRMISEESRSGLLEYLLTAPVVEGAIVGGKFLAALTFMALLFASSLVYGLVLKFLGVPPDWGPVLGSYMGAVLCSALFCASGLFFSSLTKTPILAAFLAFLFNLAWLMLPRLGQLFDVELLNLFISKVDVLAHFQSSFMLGVFDTAQVAFFVVWTLFFLFLTVLALQSRRWR